MRCSIIRCAVVAGALSLLSITSARAATLTFEGFAHDQDIPNGYGGLNWTNFHALNTTYETTTYGPSGYEYSAVSGTNVAVNSYGAEALTSGSSFEFDSAYFTSAWNDGLNIQVTGYLSGVQVDQKIFTVNTSGPTLENFGWSNVDTVKFDSYGGTSHGFASNGSGTEFAMDNFTINGAQSAAPLPSTAYAGLGLLGVLGCGMLARRKRVAA